MLSKTNKEQILNTIEGEGWEYAAQNDEFNNIKDKTFVELLTNYLVAFRKLDEYLDNNL